MKALWRYEAAFDSLQLLEVGAIRFARLFFFWRIDCVVSGSGTALAWSSGLVLGLGRRMIVLLN